MENLLCINKSFSSLLPLIFKSCFTFCYDVHNYQIVSSTTDKIFKPSYRTDSYGKNSVTIGNLKSVIGQRPLFQHCYAKNALRFKLFNVFLHFKHDIGQSTKINFLFVSYLLVLYGPYRQFQLTFLVSRVTSVETVQ